MTKRFRKPCDVCFENTIHKTKCGHDICRGCLTKWLKDHHTCPTCRTILKEYTLENSLIPLCNYLLRNYDIYLLFHNHNDYRYEITSTKVKMIEKYENTIGSMIHHLYAQRHRHNTNNWIVKFIEKCNHNVSMEELLHFVILVRIG